MPALRGRALRAVLARGGRRRVRHAGLSCAGVPGTAALGAGARGFRLRRRNGDVSSAAGRSKVDLARQCVRQLNPWSEIVRLEADVATLTPAMFNGIDVALCTLDSPRGRLLGARLLLAARVPFVDAGALAEQWLARCTVADPTGRRGDPGAEPSCPICGWSREMLARSGEDLGFPCASVLDTGEGAASTLTSGQRAAGLAVREALALAGVVGLRPSVGREIREDLRSLRVESFRVPFEPGCAADHVLAGEDRVQLDHAPVEVRVSDLARTCRLEPEDTIVLATSELVHIAVCRQCREVARPLRRIGSPRLTCSRCGAPLVPVRRARRVRWAEAAASVGHASAADWFEPGDAFAVEGRGGARVYRFPAPPLAWEPGAAWHDETARPRFRRLPSDYDLDAVRRTRVAFLGLGHVGSAALQQLAPLPFAGFLLVDRDRIEEHNLPSSSLPVEDPRP